MMLILLGRLPVPFLLPLKSLVIAIDRHYRLVLLPKVLEAVLRAKERVEQGIE
jgi:hypothetical protein